MVHANTDRGVMFFTNLEERNETVADLLQLGSIFLIRIFLVVEGFYFIHIVSRIDTYFLYLDSRCICCFRVEMDIGHQRRRISLLIQ